MGLSKKDFNCSVPRKYYKIIEDLGGINLMDSGSLYLKFFIGDDFIEFTPEVPDGHGMKLKLEINNEPIKEYDNINEIISVLKDKYGIRNIK